MYGKRFQIFVVFVLPAVAFAHGGSRFNKADLAYPWIREIRFIETAAAVGKGYGGKNEDDEYFDLLPYI